MDAVPQFIYRIVPRRLIAEGLMQCELFPYRVAIWSDRCKSVT
jgi:hypothetical protein